MSEPFLAQITMFGGNFAPRSWAFCDGQLLAISSNTALFSLLGTTYGGDGRTTFGLPELRGRVAIHPGSGPGLSPYRLGQKGGVETVALSTAQMPAHNHSPTLHAESTAANNTAPAGNMLASANTYSAPARAADVAMSPDSIQSQNVGGGQAHTNIQPYQCVNYIIALVGVYPSRN